MGAIKAVDFIHEALGIARSGSVAAYPFGDIFLAFSTANAEAMAEGEGPHRVDFLGR